MREREKNVFIYYICYHYYNHKYLKERCSRIKNKHVPDQSNFPFTHNYLS